MMVLEPGPSFSVADVCRGWIDGLREVGVDVGVLNFSNITASFISFKVHADDGTVFMAFSEDDAVAQACRIAESQAFRWQPDVLFIVSGFYVTPGMLQAFRYQGITTVVVCTESPYEDDRQIHFADQVDYVLLNDPTNLERFRQVNPNTFYVPHAYDPKQHFPGPLSDDLVCDFGFCGTGYPSRVNFLERVDFTGIDVKLAGYWKNARESELAHYVVHDIENCFDNEETVELYRSSKVSANLYRKEANEAELVAGWAMGPREVELAAIGTFFLRDPRGEGDDVFPMLPRFYEPGDFGEKLRWWLDHDAEREKAAQAARIAIEDRTFSANAKWLAGLLDN